MVIAPGKAVAPGSDRYKKQPPRSEVAKPKVLVGGKTERAAGVAGKLLGALVGRGYRMIVSYLACVLLYAPIRGWRRS